MLVRVYTCQNVKLLEISCPSQSVFEKFILARLDIDLPGQYYNILLNIHMY